MNSIFFSLLILFGSLSLASIGGGNTVIPDIHREAVLVHHWLTDGEFIAAFAITQAAPGPGSLIVALVGWKAAGWPGAIVATIAMYGPSCTLTYVSSRLWLKFQNNRWQTAIEQGLAPISMGLIFASGWVIAQSIDTDWLAYLFIAFTIWNVVKMKLNPLWIMVVAAFTGIIEMLI
ncbi:MAG: chromate transporter [Veillonellales bacterium]